MYGTKRSNPARPPQSAGVGMPIAHRPRPMTRPKLALMPSWAMKNRLRRSPASSSASVVRCRSVEPKTRMKRSRRSSFCSRMNTATMNTRKVVSSGASTGSRIVRATVSADVLRTGELDQHRRLRQRA